MKAFVSCTIYDSYRPPSLATSLLPQREISSSVDVGKRDQ